VVKKELIGTKLSEFEFDVERGKVKEFASAICDPNPIYRDKEYARKRGFSDVLMPVTFPTTFPHHQESENYILESALKVGMDPAKSVLGESEMFLQRPVCAGECLRGEERVVNVYEKEGKRSGTMTFVEVEINFYDAQDEPVVIMRNIHIERG
jgi:acyl dehydratase